MRTEGRSDRESFKGTLIRETERAFLFEPDIRKDGPIWLPRSQVSWIPDSDESDQTQGAGGWMMIPQWLCAKHDLEK